VVKKNKDALAITNMTLEEIVLELKKYYPFGIPFLDESYQTSAEFKNNRIVLAEGYHKGIELAQKVNKDLSIMLNSDIHSYSFAAGYFCHHYSFYKEESPNEIYSLIISYIIPFYIIRTLRIDTWEEEFVSFQDRFPEEAKLIHDYVLRIFPGYQLLTDHEFLNQVIDGVEKEESEHPTLLHLAFTTVKA